MDLLAVAVSQTLTDIGEIRQRLLEAEQLEKDLDAEIAAACKDVGSFRYLEPDVLKTVTDLDRAAPGMHSAASSTVAEAEQIIARTRQLDAAHGRVQQALERVEDVLDLKSCVSGVQTALQNGNLHMAAMHIKRFRSVQTLVQVQDEDREVMQRAESQLASLVEARFQAAIQANDMDSVKTCCQLTNILGKAEKGLDRYLTFVCQQLQAELAEERRHMHGTAADPAYTVNVASAIFSKCVRALQEAEAVAGTNFGTEAGPARVIAAINDVCDKQASDVVLAFLHSERIKQALQHASKPVAVPSPDDSSFLIQRRITDALISEVGIVIQRCVTYMRLMRSKAEEVDAMNGVSRSVAVSPGSPIPTSVSPSSSGTAPTALALLHEKCELQKAVAELAGVYTALEERFLADGLRMAVAFDERLGDSLLTSMVEESFYVLQQCSSRSFATGSSDCVGGVLNHVVAMVDSALLGELRGRFEAAAAVCGGSGVALDTSDGQLTPEYTQLCTICNNIEACESFASQFVESLRGEVGSVFSGEGRQLAMVSARLDDVLEVVENIKRLNQSTTTKLCALLTPRLRSAMNIFSGASSLIQYELTEAEYSSRQSFDLFGSEFLQRLDDLIAPLKTGLSSELQGQFVAKIAAHVSKNLESLLMRKRFNHLGAMQFERDVRSLVTFFTERSSNSVKSKLTRLTQLSRLLALESPSELLDYWGANEGPVPWEFNGSEAKRVLGLRSDFSPDAVTSLPL